MSKKSIYRSKDMVVRMGAVKYITEKDYTLKTAKLVAQYLKEAGSGI